jgi:hypothetical protein
MRLPVAFLAALFAYGFAFPSSGFAAVKSYKDLTVDQRVSLQESERRLALFDRTLQAIEVARQSKKMSYREYAWQRHDLIAYIGAEAKFQNDLLIKNRGMSEDTREVLENIEKYTVLVPAYILAIAARGVGGMNYSP